MTIQPTARPSGVARASARALLLVLPCSALLLSCQHPPVKENASNVAQGVSLGSASAFAVLASATVTNTGPTTITGDLGVSPGLAITGFPPGTASGTIHAGDAAAAQAQTDVMAAYTTLAGQACDLDLSGQDLGGLTLTPGVYCFSTSAQLTGTLTLDALGDPDAVFTFQVASTLTTASNSSVTVIHGGIDCNVFWQVGTSATLGTHTSFTGNVLALASVTLETSTQVSGRVFGRNGAVTLDDNQVGTGNCQQGQGGSGGSGGMGGATTTTSTTTTSTGGMGGTGGTGGTGGATTTTTTTTTTGSSGGTGGTGGAGGGTTGSGGDLPDHMTCGGVCVYPKTDTQNCGGCGIVCNPTDSCIEGVCTPCQN